MNKTVLIGRLTADPQSYSLDGGKSCARFTLAVNRPTNRDGDRNADFINILAWEKQAETVVKYLTKGRQVAVVGRIQTGVYEKNGVKRQTFEVVAENVEFIGTAQNGAETQNSRPTIDTLRPVEDDDDMPF